MKKFAVAFAALSLFVWAAPSHAQQVITLNGAVQFNDDHAFTKSLVKFEELVIVWQKVSMLISPGFLR